MAENLNLIQKLTKIRSMCDVVQKDKKGYNYTYTQITTILASVTAGMKKFGVSLIPSIVPGTSNIGQNVISNIKFDKTGNRLETRNTEMLYSAEMIFKWVNDDNPDEYLEIPWFVTGSQSDPAQAMGTGLTYTTRQFLTAYFQIAQTDQDIDEFRSKQKAAEDIENQAILAGIISEIDKIVKDLIQKNPDKTEDVKKYISRFAKNSNYLAIKDLTTASNLINGLKETFKENLEKKEGN